LTNDAERRFKELEAQIDATSSVLAPVTGRITEIKVSQGAVANAGMPIASIQSGDQGLELVLYVPPRHGKEVRRGMLAHARRTGVARSPTLSQTDVLSRRRPVRSAEQQAGKGKERAECERREDRFFMKNPVRRDYQEREATRCMEPASRAQVPLP